VSHPKEITLHVGGVHASAEPTVISTLLGSCVAVCLWDAQVGVGGMNHFLLPEPGAGTSLDDEPTRFGAHAMDRLIGEMLKLGAAPSRFVVKVFGGASVLAIPGASASIPRANIEFVRSYLAREGLTVAATSVGGTLPRQIRRVGTTDARAAIAEEERAERRQRRRFGDVTLFGGPRG
jgi:chemotaxis protein CheD